jgi:hypothetical protein
MDQMDAKGKSLEGAADLCSFSVVSWVSRWTLGMMIRYHQDKEIYG